MDECIIVTTLCNKKEIENECHESGCRIKFK